jgi:TPR repeat protein
MTYFRGQGIDADPVGALGLFDDACSSGEATACVNAAIMYRDGLGVPSDAVKAASAWKVACDLGRKDACSELGDGAIY